MKLVELSTNNHIVDVIHTVLPAILHMEHSTSAPNGRVLRTTQLAKLSFNQPPVVLTADIFQYFYKKYNKQQQFHNSHDHTSTQFTQHNQHTRYLNSYA